MKQQTYYAIYRKGDYIESGKNARSPKEAAMALYDLESPQMDEPEIATQVLNKSPEDFIISMGCALHKQNEPFN